jgi:hypothetical protein
MVGSIDVKTCGCGKVHDLRSLPFTDKWQKWEEFGLTVFECDACHSHISVKTEMLVAVLLGNAWPANREAA